MCEVGKGKQKLINQPNQQLKVVDTPSDFEVSLLTGCWHRVDIMWMAEVLISEAPVS